MEPYLGEIRIFTWDWAPEGWALCNGAVLPVQQYAALYTLFGFAYGGNKQTTFALPDLRGRVAVHTDQWTGQAAYPMGATAGTETVTLTTSQLPAHTHQLAGVGVDGSLAPVLGAMPATPKTVSPTATVMPIYGAADTLVPLAADTVSTVGGGAHGNVQPFTVLNFCIAMLGYYPQRP
jgi:Microcystin-dependent protein